MSKLGGLTNVPKVADFRALAISILIDIITFAFKTLTSQESMEDVLNRVFADEASSVSDDMEEGLKRRKMNMMWKR